MRGAALILFFADLAGLVKSNADIHPLPNADTSLFCYDAPISRIALPFGAQNTVQFSEPSLVQIAETRFDINNIASDEQWNKYKAKGVWYSCLLDMTIEKAGKALEDSRVPPSAEAVWQGDFRSRSPVTQELLPSTDQTTSRRRKMGLARGKL